ncbi:MAG: cytochrome P460 family protein [Candidatus Thiodiazotropha sp. (ex Dulcina madagascariensis)]|nr:cytochrome P460 family protein [Candidatus Thiodiazotropha sp. (ex Dulcina madagascariensis)]
MNKRIPKLSLLFSGVTAVMVAMIPLDTAQADGHFMMKDGMLKRPVGYREWIYVGTPLTPNDMNNGKAAFPEFHNVYIHPKSWAYWKAKGEFPEDTIIVKELVNVGSKKAVSGNGYFMGDFLGLEAIVKSAKHFPNEPGNWAFFSFSMPDHKSLKASAKPFPAEACNACHQANASTDWVFTQYYPVLRGAKGVGHDGTAR